MPRTSPLRLLALVLAVVLLGVGLGACGDDDDAADTPAPPATSAPATTAPPATGPSGGTLQLAADPGGALAFDTTSLTAPAGSVTIVLANESPVPHNVAVEGPGVDTDPSETIQGGESAELTVELPAGEYEFYCDVLGHRQAGMEGTLTVG